MKKVLLSMLFAAVCLGMSAQTETQPNTVNQEDRNYAIYARVASKLLPQAGNMPMNELMIKVALEFLGTDYLWASLETVPERLHVYLDKTDCILFVEMTTCFALTLKGYRIVQAGDGEHYALRPTPSVERVTPCYETLCDNIRNMRYRLGVVDGYSSRVHYTSEWILQNQTNGIMREISKDLGEEVKQPFYYMSMHPKTYFQLLDDPCELGRIRMMEERLTAQNPYYFVSQEQLRKKEIMDQIQSGDIVTFMDTHPGLDLAHVAIAYRLENGEMHFIHASYGKKKVVIEDKSLADYAKNGIRVIRPF